MWHCGNMHNVPQIVFSRNESIDSIVNRNEEHVGLTIIRRERDISRRFGV